MAKATKGVVVTGSDGFIGRVVVDQVRALYPRLPILTIDIKTGDDLHDPATIEKVREFDPFVVFHLAAHHVIPWCNAHPQETIRLNAAATHSLLSAVRAEKVVLASSAAVYGLTADVEHGHTELCPATPDDVYGLSKVWAEHALWQYSTREKVGVVAARLYNVVGQRGQDPNAHLHPKVMDRAGKEMSCNLEALGEHRDYVHVDDAARSLIDLAEHIIRPGFVAVNVCTGVTLTGQEMCQMYDVTPVDDPSLRRPSGGHLRGVNALLQETCKRAPTAPWERLLWGR